MRTVSFLAAPQAPVVRAVEDLGCDALAASRLFMACRRLVAEALRSPSFEAADLLLAVPPGTHPRLAKLIAIALAAALPGWRDAAVRQAPSLPRLQRVAWGVTMGSASDAARRSGVPAVTVQCDVTAQPRSAGRLPGTSTVSFELGKETLGVLMEGFGRIRDQLDALSASAGGGGAADAAAASASS